MLRITLIFALLESWACQKNAGTQPASETSPSTQPASETSPSRLPASFHFLRDNGINPGRWVNVPNLGWVAHCMVVRGNQAIGGICDTDPDTRELRILWQGKVGYWPTVVGHSGDALVVVIHGDNPSSTIILRLEPNAAPSAVVLDLTGYTFPFDHQADSVDAVRNDHLLLRGDASSPNQVVVADIHTGKIGALGEVPNGKHFPNGGGGGAPTELRWLNAKDVESRPKVEHGYIVWVVEGSHELLTDEVWKW